MKCLLINLIVFVIVVDSDTSKPLFLPQLPVGEYRVNVLAVVRCDSTQSNNDPIKINFYLSKTSANTSEIKGNITNSVPIDDSLDVEINMAVKDSIGGWKENAHIFKTSKACSSVKTFFGDSWTRIADRLGIDTACPIPVGFYRARGLKTDKNLFSNFPKKFFYGTYKMRVHYGKNNIVYCCITFVIEVKRPWETD